MKYNRRNFIKGMAMATAAVPFAGAFAAGQTPPAKKYPVSFFTKSLDGYELDFVAESLAMAGIDGLELPVRPKGRVEPERVKDDLPRAIEVGKKYGLETGMIVSAITAADDPYARDVLATAARCGVKHYRLGYYSYDQKKGIAQSLPGIKEKLTGLAQLNAELGIQAGYQNHSGAMFGSALWDLWDLIKDMPVQAISCQYDVRHAVAEGANSWILAYRLIHKNIGSLVLKDFNWDVSGGKARMINVPMGEGFVNFDLFFSVVKELGIVAPLTLHIEYPFLGKDEETLSLLEKQRIIVSKLRKDVNFIHEKLAQYQLI